MQTRLSRGSVSCAIGAALLVAVWTAPAAALTTATSDVDGQLATVQGGVGDDRITLRVDPPASPELPHVLTVEDPGGVTPLDACVQVGPTVVTCNVRAAADVFGGAGNDTVDFSYAPGAQPIGVLTLLGGDGNDDLRGSELADAEINGGPGDDRLDGRGGADFIDCGEGVDTLVPDMLDTVNPGCENVADVIPPQATILSGPSGIILSRRPTVSGAAAAGTVRVTSNGSFVLGKHRVTCPAGGSRCRVTTTARKRAVRLGGSSYRLAAGKRGAAKVALSRKGLRLLRRSKRVRATVTVTVAQDAQTATKKVKVTLRAPRSS